MKFMKNDEAVSPVIGVILMVAITVILAAVIGAFVFGMAGNVQKSKTVAATASATSSGLNKFIYVTYQGGADAGEVSSISASNGTVLRTISNTVGNSTIFSGTLGAKTDHITVSATFNDGTSQVILDTFV